MTITSNAYFSEDRLLVTAGELLSDHGDNPEWDRALVALVATVLGRPHDMAAVRTLIIQTYSRHVPDPQYPDFSMFDEDNDPT